MVTCSSSVETLDPFSNPAKIGDSSNPTGADLPVVVVVDDDVDSLALISYVLEQFPCLLFCETEGNAALQLSLKLKPDLILLDIRLPGLSGFDIVRILRSHQATEMIPVIAVTALASPQDQQEILQAGFSHYVSKPYLLEDIISLVSQYLIASSV